MVTPMQLLCAFAAIANGGKLMRPYLVEEIRDRSGKLIKKTEPQVIRQVVSKETADITRMMLRSVVARARETGGSSRLPRRRQDRDGPAG